MRCRAIGIIFGALALLVGGCAGPVISPQSNNTVILVPGIGGNDWNYRQVCPALADGGCRDCLQTFDWSPGWELCFLALSWGDLHDSAEKHLAEIVIDWRSKHPGSRIVLIGHSAGAGVILGMLGRLPPDFGNVGPVILLAPSISPDYDLRAALAHTDIIHVFFSDKDDLWQGFGQVVFGGYDGIHRIGAGQRGFSLMNLNASEKARIVQHPWLPKWDSLGEHGGHFDWLKHDFVMHVIEPIVDRRSENLAAGH
jgi:pimeloyl-ACP methyl ester carboxylesterase